MTNAPKLWKITAQARAVWQSGDLATAREMFAEGTKHFPDATGMLEPLMRICLLLNDRAGALSPAEKLAEVAPPTRRADFARMRDALRTGVIRAFDSDVHVPAEVVSGKILLQIWSENYEGAERRALASDLTDEDRVLELGAGIGAMALTAHHVAPKAAYLAVEANPAVFATLQTNIEENGSEAAALCGLASLSDGRATLNVPEDFWAASVHDLDAPTNTLQTAEFDTRRLLREHAPTVLIMDIEGAETDLLGALDLSGLRRLIIEFHPTLTGNATVTTCLKTLIEAGFDLDLTGSSGDVLVFERAAAPT